MSFDHNDTIDLTDEQTSLVFLTELDSMIESTEEFIADDTVTPDNDPQGRIVQLVALRQARKVYEDFHSGLTAAPDYGESPLATFNAQRDDDAFAAINYGTQRSLIAAAVRRLPRSAVLIEHMTGAHQRTYALVRLTDVACEYVTYLLTFTAECMPSRCVTLVSGNYGIRTFAQAGIDLEMRVQ